VQLVAHQSSKEPAPEFIFGFLVCVVLVHWISPFVNARFVRGTGSQEGVLWPKPALILHSALFNFALAQGLRIWPCATHFLVPAIYSRIVNSESILRFQAEPKD
jgi:hypothetical protein